jgi:WD40 repeat protein/Tfp pilus assembly protein PilF
MESQITQTPILLNKLRQAHLHVPDWQQESLTFVPLRGTWFVQSEHSFDLEEEINKFLSSNKKVLTLLGDSGSGKSLYTQGLASKLWQDHKPNSPIPIWISLPSLKNPINKAIEETFEKFGFNSKEIENLKLTKIFLFIFDAFDEIHQLKNLWVSNHCDQWNAKIIITCRREYLYYVDNYKLYFTPFNGEKALHQDYEEIIIKPFNTEQIDLYIKQYIQQQKPEWNSIERYQKAIEEIPGLKNLIKTPFLLKLAMDALPKMPQDKEQKYMTQAKLYDVFIEQWFIRQEQKLKLAKKIKENEDIKPEFWDYAKKLAQLMHQHKATQINYDSSQASDLFGEVEDNPWQKFFNAENPRIELLRTACLVRKLGQHQYAFVHASLLEYFLTRNLYENLLSEPSEIKIEKETPKLSQPETKKQDGFNEELFVEEANIIQMLADRVGEGELFKKSLFDQIYISKNNSAKSIGSANAITILNKAKISFSGMDFSGIRIPAADLSYGVFYDTNLSDTDLTNVKLQNAWLQNVNFQSANLQNVAFDDKQNYEHRGASPLLISGDSRWIVATHPNGVNIIDPENERIICTVEGSSEGFSPDGTLLLARKTDGNSLVIFDVLNQNVLHIFKNVGMGERDSSTFSHDGKLLALARTIVKTKNVLSGILWFYDVRAKNLLFQFEWDKPLSKAIFSPDGTLIASSSEDGNIPVWDINTRQIKYIYKEQSGKISHILFTRDGKTLITLVKNSKTINFWSMETGEKLAALDKTESLKNIVLSPDGQLIAAIGSGLDIEGMNIVKTTEGKISNIHIDAHTAAVTIWSVATRELQRYLVGDPGKDFISIAFSNDSKLLAAGSEDNMVRIWEAATGEELYRLRHDSDVTDVQFSPNGKFLLASVRGNKLAIWNQSNRKIQHTLRPHAGGVLSLAFNSSMNLLASGSEDRSIRLLDVHNFQLLTILNGHDSWVKSLSFNQDGKLLASVGAVDETVRVWDIVSKQEIKKINLKQHASSVAISPDQSLLAVGSWSEDKNIWLWDTKNWELRCKLESCAGTVTTLAFSPNGKYLASGGTVGSAVRPTVSEERSVTLWIWDLTLAPLKGLPIPAVKGYVSSIKFSPDGKLMAIAVNKILAIFEVGSWKNLYTLKGHTAQVSAIDFSPDGKTLASASQDGFVFLWDTDDVSCYQNLGNQGTAVLSIAWINANSLFTGDQNGILRQWKIEKHGKSFKYWLWASNHDSLYIQDCKLEDVRGLSPQNAKTLNLNLGDAYAQTVKNTPSLTEAIKSSAFQETLTTVSKYADQVPILKDFLPALNILSPQNKDVTSAETQLATTKAQAAAKEQSNTFREKLPPNMKTLIPGLEKELKALLPTEDVSSLVDSWVRAILAFNAEKYADCITECDALIKIIPKLGPLFKYRGKAKLKLERFKESIVDLDEAINLHTVEGDVYDNRAYAKSKLKDYEEAIADSSRAIDFDATVARYYSNRGYYKAELNRHAEAIKDYDIAIRLDPKFTSCLFLRITSKNKLKLHDEALQDCDALINLDKTKFLHFRLRAETNFYREKHEEAIKDYDVAIELKPSDSGLFCNRCLAKLKMGKNAEALQDINEAIKLNSNIAGYFSSRASVYRALGKSEEAIKDYDSAIKLNSKSAIYFNDRGLLKKVLKLFNEAIADYNAAINLDGSDSEYYRNRGDARYLLGEKEESIKDYSKAIQLNPNIPAYYISRGIVYDELNKHEEAIRGYDEAIRLNAKYAVYFLNRGIAKSKLNRNEEAIKDFDEAIKLDANIANYFYWRAIIYQKINQPQKALKDYDAAIQLAPQVADYFNRRAVVKVELKLLKEAIVDYSKAIELSPHQLYFTNRAKSRSELNQIDEALNDCESALQLQPNYSQALFEKATIYFEKLGKYSEAIKIYDAIIEADKTFSKDYSILRFKGCALFYANKFKQALETFNELLKDDDGKAAYSPCYKGYILLSQGEQENAEKLFTHVLSIKSNFYLALVGKGLVKRIENQLDLAKSFFQQAEKAAESTNEKIEVYFIQAKVLEKLGFIEEARLALHAALQIKPDYIPVLEELKKFSSEISQSTSTAPVEDSSRISSEEKNQKIPEALSIPLSLEDKLTSEKFSSSSSSSNVSSDTQKGSNSHEEVILMPVKQEDKLERKDPSVSSNSQTFFQPPRDNDKKQEKSASKKCCTVI